METGEALTGSFSLWRIGLVGTCREDQSEAGRPAVEHVPVAAREKEPIGSVAAHSEIGYRFERRSCW